MHFQRILPGEALTPYVKEFWIYENPDTQPAVQKIIPDGYSEIIIHHGDPYEINLDPDGNKSWEPQESLLFSSQISKYFFLQNTGRSGVLGIKLQPTAFYELFGLDVSAYVDQVVPLTSLLDEEQLPPLTELANPNLEEDAKIQLLEDWFLAWIDQESVPPTREAVNIIFEKNGLVDIQEISDSLGLGERQIERTFKKAVGLSPKFFSRIVRFNYIFEIMKKGDNSWVQIALESGYFDQSHFIKNFKEFTGEEPSAYGFEENNLANFFLKK